MSEFYRVPDLLSGRTRAGGGVGVDTIRGHMEKQPDGSVVYKVVFDVHGYAPDDLRTSLIGGRTVQVSGRTNLEDQTTGKVTSMSFEEQFTLPENVDTAQLRSVVVNSQLVISVPVLPPQYKLDQAAILKSPPARLYAQQQSQQPLLLSSPKSTSPSTSYNFHATTGPQLQPQQVLPPQPQLQQPQQQLQQSTVKRLNVCQLELDLGREFTSADLRVSTQDGGSRLVVHGQRQVRAAGKTSFREFRDEFDLPPGLDLAKMTARLRSDGRVFVEAPFRVDTESLAGGAGYDFQTLPVLHQ